MACPSDPGTLNYVRPDEPSRTVQRVSYCACMGDDINSGSSFAASALARKRGFFGGGSGYVGLVCRSFADIIDGTSNTIAVSEACVGQTQYDNHIKGGIAHSGSQVTPSSCLVEAANLTNPGQLVNTEVFQSGRGWNHSCGSSPSIVFQTVLSPNAPSCMWRDGTAHVLQYNKCVIASASSYHSGGVNTLYADGTVHFISDTIDNGPAANLAITSQPDEGQSLFGIWGALGSINGGETLTP